MEIEARIVRLELAETFVISRESTDFADVVHVALTHEGVTGYGEGAPVERYDESTRTAKRSPGWQPSPWPRPSSAWRPWPRSRRPWKSRAAPESIASVTASVGASRADFA